jgi:hypothetical protein
VHYWPHLEALAPLLHPLLLAVYCVLQQQLQGFEKKERERSPQEQPDVEKETVFGELGDYRCSRVTFLNLDGQDSALNLLLSKYLHKYLQYISFPLDRSASLSPQFLPS